VVSKQTKGSRSSVTGEFVKRHGGVTAGLVTRVTTASGTHFIASDTPIRVRGSVQDDGMGGSYGAPVGVEYNALHSGGWPLVIASEAVFSGDNVAVGVSLTDAAEAAIAEAKEGDPLPPVHPGEILLEDFIRPHGLSPIRAAQKLGVPRTRIERLVTGQTSMTPDTALRLERLFGASAEFWMNLQTAHDLRLAREAIASEISAIEPLPQEAPRAR
jgi:addiction module HigA family antidote